MACTLHGSRLGERTAQEQQVPARATDRRDITDRVVLVLPAAPELAADVAAPATAERDCCAFFDFTLHLTPAALELTVRAPATVATSLTDPFGVTA